MTRDDIQHAIKILYENGFLKKNDDECLAKMPSFQIEKGYFWIANEIADVLSLIKLNGSQHRLLWWFFRDTYGWVDNTDKNKKLTKWKWDGYKAISLKTGMNPKQVIRELKNLIKMNVLMLENGYLKLNKMYPQWNVWGVDNSVDNSVDKLEVTNQLPGKRSLNSYQKGNGSVTKKVTNQLPDTLLLNKRKKTLKKEERERAVEKTNGHSLAPNQDFVERFKKAYQLMTNEPYKYDKTDFILTARLIRDHGYEACVKKAQMLGHMCKSKTSWFTKDGWASFSIKTLSAHWNGIIPNSTKSKEQIEREEMEIEKQKVRERNERVSSMLNSKRRN